MALPQEHTACTGAGGSDAADVRVSLCSTPLRTAPSTGAWHSAPVGLTSKACSADRQDGEVDCMLAVQNARLLRRSRHGPPHCRSRLAAVRARCAREGSHTWLAQFWAQDGSIATPQTFATFAQPASASAAAALCTSRPRSPISFSIVVLFGLRAFPPICVPQRCPCTCDHEHVSLPPCCSPLCVNGTGFTDKKGRHAMPCYRRLPFLPPPPASSFANGEAAAGAAGAGAVQATSFPACCKQLAPPQ